MPGREAKFGDAYWVNRDSTDYPRALASPSVRWRAWRSVEAIRGQAVPGRFYAGALWGSSTLTWDAAWFRAQGVKMPKGSHYVVPGRDKVPLTDRAGSHRHRGDAAAI